jgi:hypothetical protein
VDAKAGVAGTVKSWCSRVKPDGRRVNRRHLKADCGLEMIRADGKLRFARGLTRAGKRAIVETNQPWF